MAKTKNPKPKKQTEAKSKKAGPKKTKGTTARPQTDDVGATEGGATHALDERNQRVADILQGLVDDGYLEDWGHSTASNGEHIYTVRFHEGKREVQRSLFLPSAESFVLGAGVVRDK